MGAVLAGRLRLHCTDVGGGSASQKRLASRWRQQDCAAPLSLALGGWTKNTSSRGPRCDEATAAVSRLDVHTHC